MCVFSEVLNVWCLKEQRVKLHWSQTDVNADLMSVITSTTLMLLWSSSYLGGGDAVDEADLLEALLTHRQTHLPALVHRLVHHFECHARLVQLILHVQIHVAAEAVHLWQDKAVQEGTNRDTVWYKKTTFRSRPHVHGVSENGDVSVCFVLSSTHVIFVDEKNEDFEKRTEINTGICKSRLSKILNVSTTVRVRDWTLDHWLFVYERHTHWLDIALNVGDENWKQHHGHHSLSFCEF